MLEIVSVKNMNKLYWERPTTKRKYYFNKRGARAFVNRNEGLILSCFFVELFIIPIAIYLLSI